MIDAQSQPWHDPELPFLAELEHEVRRMAERAAALPGGDPRGRLASRPPRPAPRRRPSPQPRERAGSRRTSAGRMARRSLALVALLCMLGASAYGAREILSGAHDNPLEVTHGRLLAVARGESGGEAWTLSLYERGGELCRVLTAAEVESSRCSEPPRPRQITVTSAASTSRRYLFGVTGADVARVSVRGTPGKARRTEPASTAVTHPIGAMAARAAGLPRTARYYVSILPRRQGAADRPLRVHGLDRAGRPVGQALVDCLETIESSTCVA